MERHAGCGSPSLASLWGSTTLRLTRHARSRVFLCVARDYSERELGRHLSSRVERRGLRRDHAGAKYRRLELAEAKLLKARVDENRRLKNLLDALASDNMLLKDGAVHSVVSPRRSTSRASPQTQNCTYSNTGRSTADHNYLCSHSGPVTSSGLTKWGAEQGVLQPSVFRGLVLSARATAARFLLLCSLKPVPFGKYCRRSPFVFSFVPRCHVCGSQK